MAILVLFTGDGGLTPDMYDSMRAELNWEKQQPAGGIVHIASFDDKGAIHVADVWNSPEELNAFVTSRLMPMIQKLKINPPKVEIFPVHNIDAYAAIDEYKV